MILKLDMHHWGMELYNNFMNRDPRLTLTYFTARSNYVPVRLNRKTLVTKLLNGKNLQQMTKLTEYLYF